MLLFETKTKNERDMKVCVFCSANNDIDPQFFEKTDELGRWLAKNGHSIVYGGCNQGLMECIAKATHEEGGRLIGVIPTKLEEHGRVSSYIDVNIPVDNLNDRKQLMMAQSDAFVVLPGGVGTLDEIFCVAASATIGYHQKPIILYNINGFWDSLVALLDDMNEKKMLRKPWRNQISIATCLEDVVGALDN